MHIAFVSYQYSSDHNIEQLLSLRFTTVDWAEALKARGHEISLILRYKEPCFFIRNGVSYYFYNDKGAGNIRPWQLALRFNQYIKKIVNQAGIEIVHLQNFYGLAYNFYLKYSLPQTPTVIQVHKHVKHLKYPIINNYFLRTHNGFIFSCKGHETYLVEKKIIDRSKSHFIMETSSRFQQIDQVLARTQTKMIGNPVFLWVGNLNQNKDPFLVIKSFQKILDAYPEAHLYMIYRHNDLESEIIKYITSNPDLKQYITLLGRKNRNELVDYYNSADYFISASHREGSGYTLIEALSCGLIPIVTRIPSFIDLTGNGTIGALFEPGNADSFVEAVNIALEKNRDKEKVRVLRYFQTNNSFEAIANKAIKVYQHLIRQSQIDN